ncbi:MAG: hypothetical protein LC623_00425 [Halobacteriales archaeon]|nr:hypothetical protein [Halobacteriales archaeon]
MRSPQTMTRRLVPAFALSLVSSLVLGALVVTAAAGDAEPALPQWFGVAERHLGDAGTTTPRSARAGPSAVGTTSRRTSRCPSRRCAGRAAARRAAPTAPCTPPTSSS